VLQAQLLELDEAKRQAEAERSAALDWKNKWNFQSYKINLAIDMLTIREYEQQRCLNKN
jgi:hypothetical protein